MKVRRAKEEDCEEVARLHGENISGGFLSSLGAGFLKYVYMTAVLSEGAYLYVLEDGGKIAGFIAGAEDTGKFYGEFLKKYFFRAGFRLAFKLMNPVNIKRVFETLSYPSKTEGSFPKAELLSMAVQKGLRGRGAGSMLFGSFVEGMKERGVKGFMTAAGSDLEGACRFYERRGGRLHSEIEIHKGRKSRIYVWKL